MMWWLSILAFSIPRGRGTASRSLLPRWFLLQRSCPSCFQLPLNHLFSQVIKIISTLINWLRYSSHSFDLHVASQQRSSRWRHILLRGKLSGSNQSSSILRLLWLRPSASPGHSQNGLPSMGNRWRCEPGEGKSKGQTCSTTPS